MNILNKIKNIFFKKNIVLFGNKRILNNEREIQEFFDKNSGWEKQKLVYFFDKKDRSITSYARFSRPATEEEIQKALNGKIDSKSYKTITTEKIWSQQLEDVLKEDENLFKSAKDIEYSP